jgi:hypothetical protein
MAARSDLGELSDGPRPSRPPIVRDNSVPGTIARLRYHYGQNRPAPARSK